MAEVPSRNHHAALTRNLPLRPLNDASDFTRHDPMRLPDVHLRRADGATGSVGRERISSNEQKTTPAFDFSQSNTALGNPQGPSTPVSRKRGIITRPSDNDGSSVERMKRVSEKRILEHGVRGYTPMSASRYNRDGRGNQYTLPSSPLELKPNMDPPTLKPLQGRRYETNRIGYTPGPKYGVDARGSSGAHDARTPYPPQKQPHYGRYTPPGYKRQGNYAVPIVTAEPLRSSVDWGRLNTREMRDPRDVPRDPRDARDHRDPRYQQSQPRISTPPGHVRQGNYLVPTSSAEPLRSSIDTQMNTREMRDPRDVPRDPRDARDPMDPRYQQLRPSDGTPPGYVRQGNYYVPISYAETPEQPGWDPAFWAQSGQTQLPPGQQVRDERDHIDPTYQQQAQLVRHNLPGMQLSNLPMERYDFQRKSKISHLNFPGSSERLGLVCQTVSRDETSAEDVKNSSFLKMAMEPHIRNAQVREA